MVALEQARLVTGHAVSGNRGDMGLAVIAHGPYSPGGAQNHYVVGVGSDLALMADYDCGAHVVGCVSFQDGNPSEFGVNGVSIESLLAVCADRLEHFEGGPFANGYNADALRHIHCALLSLKGRTRERDGESMP